MMKVEDVQSDVHWDKFTDSQTLRRMIIPPVFTLPVNYCLGGVFIVFLKFLQWCQQPLQCSVIKLILL